MPAKSQTDPAHLYSAKAAYKIDIKDAVHAEVHRVAADVALRTVGPRGVLGVEDLQGGGRGGGRRAGRGGGSRRGGSGASRERGEGGGGVVLNACRLPPCIALLPVQCMLARAAGSSAPAAAGRQAHPPPEPAPAAPARAACAPLQKS